MQGGALLLKVSTALQVLSKQCYLHNIYYIYDICYIYYPTIYRVAGLSCPEAGGCKLAILRGFPDVFSLFGPCKVGKISFRYSWTTGMKKKSEILS